MSNFDTKIYTNKSILLHNITKNINKSFNIP